MQLLGWLAGSGHPSPQGSLHLLAAQADSPKTASRQHLRIFRQVNDPAACETSPEGMKVAEHGRLEPQTSLHFPQSLELAANQCSKTVRAQRTKEPT